MNKKKSKKQNKKPLMIGLLGGAILLLIYFSILTIANSFSHAVEQFLSMWYWISILVVGFGIQVGLYSHIRTSAKARTKIVSAEVAASGGISTSSMVACCLHHVADVLPILGISAAALFLLAYQVPFIILGVFSNLVGITLMLSIIQRHKLFLKKSLLSNLFKYDMKSARNIAVVLSVIIVSIAFISTAFSAEKFSGSKDYGLSGQLTLQEKTNSENGVSISVKPIDFSFSREIKFDITLNTHQGSLDFDLTEISVLEDDKGKEYSAIGWEGSPTGGHHRSGILVFPKLDYKSTYIKLVLKNVYKTPERIFVWDLNNI